MRLSRNLNNIKTVSMVCLIYLIYSVCVVKAGESRIINLIADTDEAYSSSETPVSLAKRMIKQLNDATIHVTTISYDNQGKQIKETSQDIPQPSDGNLKFSDVDQEQILKSLDNMIPSNEFALLPSRRKNEILGAIKTFVENYPDDITGRQISDEDKAAKLDYISQILQRMKKNPVIYVKSPELVAKQLSFLIGVLADDAMRHCGVPLSSVPEIRSETVKLLEDSFCRFARDTTIPELKRPLPETTFQLLVTNLKNSLKTGNTIKLISIPSPTLKTILGLKSDKLSQFLDQENRLTLIADNLSSAEFLRANNIILSPYVMQSRVNDLAGIDFTGGVTDEERMKVGRELQVYMNHETSRVLEAQAARLQQFMKIAESNRLDLKTKPQMLSAKGRFIVVGSIVIGNLAIIMLATLVFLRQKKAT